MPRVTKRQKEAGHPASKSKPSSSKPGTSGPSRSFVSSRPAIRGASASSRPYNHTSKPSGPSGDRPRPRPSGGASGNRGDRGARPGRPAPGGPGGGDKRRERDGGKVRSSAHPTASGGFKAKSDFKGRDSREGGGGTRPPKFASGRDGSGYKGKKRDDGAEGEKRKGQGFRVGPAHAPRNAYLGKGTFYHHLIVKMSTKPYRGVRQVWTDWPKGSERQRRTRAACI